MHDLAEHLAYLSDSTRLARFESALRAVVKPGDRVADLGCGTGVLGMLALEAGAAHVSCVDAGPMLDVAREAFRRTGKDDRVSWHRERAQRAVLVERAQVAVCDHVGHFGIDYGIVELLRDARARMLAPDGVVVPSAVRLYVAPVESPRPVGRPVAWDEMPAQFRWMREIWSNTKHPVRLRVGDLLGPAILLGTVPLGVDVGEFLSWTVELAIRRAGSLDGIAGWFEADLAPGVSMTNSPLVADRIERPQAFLPIEPVRVAAGDHVRATMMFRHAEDVMAWDVEGIGAAWRSRHSTLFSAMLSREAVKRAGARAARLDEARP